MSKALKWGYRNLIIIFGSFLKLTLYFWASTCLLGVLYNIIGLMRENWVMPPFYSGPIALLTPLILMIVSSLLFFILEEYYLFQMTRIGFALYDHKSVEWTTILDPKNFFTFLGARWLYMIKVFLGTLLLIIPGAYLFVKYFFTGFPIIDGLTNSVLLTKN